MNRGKKVNPRRRPASQADVERAKRTAVSQAINQTQAIVFLALLDKEGWDREQLLKLWHEVGGCLGQHCPGLYQTAGYHRHPAAGIRDRPACLKGDRF